MYDFIREILLSQRNIGISAADFILRLRYVCKRDIYSFKPCDTRIRPHIFPVGIDCSSILRCKMSLVPYFPSIRRVALVVGFRTGVLSAGFQGFCQSVLVLSSFLLLDARPLFHYITLPVDSCLSHWICVSEPKRFYYFMLIFLVLLYCFSTTTLWPPQETPIDVLQPLTFLCARKINLLQFLVSWISFKVLRHSVGICLPWERKGPRDISPQFFDVSSKAQAARRSQNLKRYSYQKTTFTKQPERDGWGRDSDDLFYSSPVSWINITMLLGSKVLRVIQKLLIRHHHAKPESK